MSVATYTKAGAKAAKAATLPKDVFGEEVENTVLIKQAYNARLASKRTVNATVKDRSEVRGGGKKPWQQKGTGRARHGSIRSPIWRGGGITFGPQKNRNYKVGLNKKARNKAIRQSLTLKATDKQVAVIDSFESKDGKTKPAAELFNKINPGRKTLLVVPEFDEFINRSTKNIPKLNVVGVTGVNVYDVMNADLILVSSKSLPELSKRLNATVTKETK